MTMGLTKTNRRLLPGFLSSSGKKNRAASVLSCGTTVTLTLDTAGVASETSGVSLRREASFQDATTHSANSILRTPRSQGFSRAASYLMRRSLVPEGALEGGAPEGGELKEEPNCEASEVGRVDDIFSSELNRCSTPSLPQLRLERAELYPIICYESDDEDTDDSTKNPTCAVLIEARLEALKIQEHLLGKDHSDAIFLSRRVHRLRAQSDLLRLSLERGCTMSRTHFLPKSAHMHVPIDYPVQ